MSTSFWEDCWVGEVALRRAFPRLFEINLGKECSVARAGYWVDNTWQWGVGWRRNLWDWEADDLKRLTDLLVCRKSTSNDSNSWRWKMEDNGTYSVKSAYHLLLQRKIDMDEDDIKLWCLIWNNWAPPKAQATAWRAVRRILATKSALQRRGAMSQNSSLSCALCQGAAETVEHLFLECTKTWALWSGCLNWLGLNAPLANFVSINLLHFCYLVNGKKQRKLLETVWVGTIWLIWMKRNDIVFNNGVWNHERVLGEIKALVWNWVIGKSGLEISFGSWSSDPIDAIVGC